MRHIRHLLPVLAIAAIAAIAAPATAGAATPGLNLVSTKCPVRDLLGNVVDSGVQKCDVDEAADLGAKSVRMFLSWATGEPGGRGRIDTGYLARFRDRAAEARARGMRTYLVITQSPSWASGSQNPSTPPANPADYANFVREVAKTVGGGSSVVYEIWNEQDERAFWSTGPDPARYAALLRAAYPAIKSADPAATVLFGPTTGNNYGFVDQVYKAGAKGSFDGLAVHTDTACLENPPDFYVRNLGRGLDGRINRFSFLGFREVRQVMLAHGDDKPIHMTELGWAAFTGKCDQPGFESQPDRKGGVTAEQQALNLGMAYRCLANYPYVTDGLWFSLRDFDNRNRSTSRYGIMGRPGQGAFVEVATRGAPPIACGDFGAPAITPLLEVRRFTGMLPLAAKATDPSGITRITFYVGGKKVRNFTGSKVGNDKVVSIDYQGAKKLRSGNHRVTIEAIDGPGNTSRKHITVRKVKASQLRKTLRTKTSTSRKVRRLKGRRARATITVSKTARLALKGKIRLRWETRRTVRTKSGKKRRRWKRIHGGLRSVSIRPTGKRTRKRVTQKLRYKGRWRLRVTYLSKAPYKVSRAKTVYFTVR